MNKATTPAALGGLLNSAARFAVVPAGAIFMMATPAEQIDALEGKRQGFLDASQAIMDSLDDGVDLTDEQADEISANAGQVASVDKRITALKTMLPQGQGRKTAPEATGGQPAAGGRRTVPA